MFKTSLRNVFREMKTASEAYCCPSEISDSEVMPSEKGQHRIWPWNDFMRGPPFWEGPDAFCTDAAPESS